MADEQIRKADTDRAVERMREAMGADPERFGVLADLTEGYPEGYDPAETPEQREARREDEATDV